MCRQQSAFSSNYLLAHLARTMTINYFFFLSLSPRKSTYSYSSQSCITQLLTIVSMTRLESPISSINERSIELFVDFFTFFSRIFFSRDFPEVFTETPSPSLFTLFFLFLFSRPPARTERQSAYFTIFPSIFFYHLLRVA